MISNHENETRIDKKDLISHAFDSYQVYLEEIEERDLKQLNLRKNKLISL